MMNQWVQRSLHSLFKRRTKVDTTYPVVISVDGNTYNFTGESLAEYIKHAEARKDTVSSLQNELSSTYKQISILRKRAYEFFNERHTSGDTLITAEVSDINELLDDMGADKLRNLYNATVTIVVSVDDIEATDEDDVVQAINDELSVDIGMFSISIQEITVDDIIES